MRRITESDFKYTKEMELNDKLWQSENEDLLQMKRDMEKIIERARELGFTGYTRIYGYDYFNECITDVSPYPLGDSVDTDNVESAGFCKALIGIMVNSINDTMTQKVRNSIVEQKRGVVKISYIKERENEAKEIYKSFLKGIDLLSEYGVKYGNFEGLEVRNCLTLPAEESNKRYFIMGIINCLTDYTVVYGQE